MTNDSAAPWPSPHPMDAKEPFPIEPNPSSGDLALEALVEEEELPFTEPAKAPRQPKGKEREIDQRLDLLDTQDEPPEEFKADDNETEAIEQHLRQWSRQEKRRRASVRQSSVHSGPALSDAVTSLSRHSSTLLKRATSKRSHRTSWAGQDSQNTRGMFPIDSGIELASRASQSDSPSPLHPDGHYDPAPFTPPLSPLSETPTERAVKTGSKFIEDLDSQALAGAIQNVSRPSTADSQSSSFFQNILAPIKAPMKPRLSVATDRQSLKSAHSASGSTTTLGMTPSSSYYDYGNASTRDLIESGTERQHDPRDSDETVRDGFRRYQASSPVGDEDGLEGLPAPRPVGWLEWIFCMVRVWVCLAELWERERHSAAWKKTIWNKAVRRGQSWCIGIEQVCSDV